jgi:16S rRNA (cytidine1402-2'-O)-methyltransferase
MSDRARDRRPEPRRDPAGTAEPGTLFVVATPIGNLEDITLRALRVLREVALVAAEDTRRTGNLLRHYAIQTPIVSLHEHNEQARVGPILARLRAGASVALVSDAGTPGISDPGAVLVRAARDAGLRVDPIPGPSAITAVLSASGIAFERFAFAGFPPIRSKERKQWFAWVSSLETVPVVCFEAPHRIHATLADLRKILVNRPISIARELTKTHEEWLILSNDQTEHPVETPVPGRGEFVLVIAAADPPANLPADSPPRDEDIASVFGQMTASGRDDSRRAVIKAVAERLGVSSKTVFDALERVKKTFQT